MRCVLTLALLALAAGPVCAETYKWVDDKGRTHYSNNPPPSAGNAKQLRQVEDRLSTYQTDPAYEQYLRRRSEQIAARQEAEWQERQRYLAAAQAAPDYYQTSMSTYPDYYYGYPAYYAPGYVVGSRNLRHKVVHHVWNQPHVSHNGPSGFGASHGGHGGHR
jgi:hypothetical protein